MEGPFAAYPPAQREAYLSVFRRQHAGKPRPPTVAAKEFFEHEDAATWKSLPRRLNRLCIVLSQWNASDNDYSEYATDESRRSAISAAIFLAAPPDFTDSFKPLFAATLRARQAKLEDSDEDMEEEESFVCEEESVYQSLRTLGWIGPEGKLIRALFECLHETILSHIRETIQGDFEDDGLYCSIEEWKNKVVDPWVRDLVGMDAYKADNWHDQLGYRVAECFCLVRIEEIFNIVVEYPSSRSAIEELGRVMERTRMNDQLGNALRDSLLRRLLHPGANTSQIIDVYINTIKVLREIDPTDRLLEKVAEPVRSYLRGRSDTVRCIITSLTDEEAGDTLYEELRRQDARPLEQVELDSDDEEEPPTEDWQPAPSLLKHRGGSRGARGGGGDILSMLVSIYGSKELFVNEYRLMLADKLLANLDYNTDREVHTLELLKLRFGEMSMRQCEIMIKDTDDSKRIISNIHSTLKEEQRTNSQPPVDSIIISHIFWPALQKEQLKHHPRIQSGLDKFGLEYGKLKSPRKLVWLNQLGTVQLELDIVEEGPDGRSVIETREFSCSPLLATLISHFEDKDEWSSQELSNETGIAEHIVQRRMNYWVSNRVVKVVEAAAIGTSHYILGSRDHWFSKHELGSAMDAEDGSEGQAVSAGAQEEEEMEIYESYIVGMLNRLEQLPLDRIHNNLKTFVAGSDHKYNKTPHQLTVFLKLLCKQDKIECGPDGMYKLVKK